MSRVSSVVLCAGGSFRFGEDNKLLANVAGRTMIERVVEAIASSSVDEIIAVTGHDREKVMCVLDAMPVRVAHNDTWQTGMASSIRTGLQAVGSGVCGVFIVPADMPLLTRQLFSRLQDEFVRTGSTRIVYPVLNAGEQRNPVLWPRRLFASLASVTGHQGGKGILERHKSAAHPVSFEHRDVFDDIDTVDDLTRMQR